MSDQLVKISDLDNLPLGELDPANDYIPIVDHSANQTKSIKVQDIQSVGGGGGAGTTLPSLGDHLDFIVYSNKKNKINSASKVSTYVLDITLQDSHGLTTGDTIKIYYDDRIQGFPQPIYGAFTITNIIANVVRITVGFDLAAGSYTTAGYIEAVGYKSYNYFYEGSKSVEIRYGNGKNKFFTTITSAVEEAYLSGGNVIVHKKTTPYSESIVLRNGVNIILEEGAIITNNGAFPIFTDDGNSIVCSILGSGVIKQLTTSSEHAILLTGSNTELILECDYIELSGPPITYSTGACINSNAKNIFIKANKVLAKSGCGILLWAGTQNFKIDVREIETGIIGADLTGSTAVITFGDGFINVNKITCNNNGHTLSHRKGKCVAYIDKQYKTNNNGFTSLVACLATQSYNDVELTLYFDEIVSKPGTQSAVSCVECGRGVMNLYGRKVTTDGTTAIGYFYSGSGGLSGVPATPTGIIQVDEIYSGAWFAVDINAGNSVPIIIKNCKIYANSSPGLVLGALNIGGVDSPINSLVTIRNCHIQQLTNNSANIAMRIGDGTQTIIMSNNELESAHSGAASIVSAIGVTSTATVHRNINIRLPIWQNRNEDSYIHFITTGGTLIQ